MSADVLAVVQMIPNEVFVAAQILQFHSLDLVVIKVKLLKTVWKIWEADRILMWYLIEYDRNCWVYFNLSSYIFH